MKVHDWAFKISFEWPRRDDVKWSIRSECVLNIKRDAGKKIGVHSEARPELALTKSILRQKCSLKHLIKKVVEKKEKNSLTTSI